jgi:hypothetical protein
MRLGLLHRILRQLTSSSTPASSPVDAPILSNKTSGWTAGDNPPGWQSEYPNAVVYDTGTNTGDKIRARWRTNGGAWTTEADQQLTSAIIIAGGWAWPLLDAATLAGGSLFEVQEQSGRFAAGVEVATSAWSNTWSDTLAGATSTAVLVTTNGVNKNSQMVVSGSPALVWHGAAAFNAYQAVRATVASTSDWIEFEETVTTLAGDFLFGFCNTTDDLSTNIAPGRNTNNGWCIYLTANQIYLVTNSGTFGTPASWNGAGIAAVGDVFTLGYKKSTSTLQLFRTRSGSTIQIGADQTSIPGPFTWAFVAAKNNDGGTCNFGATAFSKTIAGATYYDG